MTLISIMREAEYKKPNLPLQEDVTFEFRPNRCSLYNLYCPTIEEHLVLREKCAIILGEYKDRTESQGR